MLAPVFGLQITVESLVLNPTAIIAGAVVLVIAAVLAAEGAVELSVGGTPAAAAPIVIVTMSQGSERQHQRDDDRDQGRP